ncbi:nucleotidyltransferase [Blautia liquoris]|uniref:Nucleotidyltransferase n=1 Tax=Blautia liquoris TaxID=2779518 RepID=A0A7M2RIW1_9FIRM|nr:sugar phosphate nucleotidyltransferase [Blautia liquoris]QOV20011.1 nucleotidyltransferase [Blautia liquoris]
MKKTSLVIMAAGIGSRFGKGIKQLEPVGPCGEVIMDYSIHDALEAGFNKVIFVIRKDLEEDFKQMIGHRIEQLTEVQYAYQELDDLPEGFEKPKKRTKPWGTGQAVLCAKDVIHEPFAVINADDYYGKEPFVKLHKDLTCEHTIEKGVHPVSMAGFVLENTLSDNGGVTRGVCTTDERGNLIGINETSNIVKTAQGAAVQDEKGFTPLDPESLVSMNMWGLRQEFLDELEEGFAEFLINHKDDEKTEYLLPTFIDELLHKGRAQVKVLKTTSNWFGVTYQEDKDSVKDAFCRLIADGIYDKNLYENKVEA